MGKTLNSYAKQYLSKGITSNSFNFMRFKKLITGMFQWNNLPGGIPSRFIEESLFNNGLCIFFEHNGMFVVSKATVQDINLYDEPTRFLAVSNNGLLNRVVNAEDCVAIWNNNLHMPSYGECLYYSDMIVEFDKTIGCNLNQLKKPYVFTGNENQKANAKILFNKIDNAEPFFFVDESLNISEHLQVLDLKANNHIETLLKCRREMINECLTYFGINNVQVDKKERLITSEAEQNDEQILINKDCMYYPRLNAIKEINEKFNLNISLGIAPTLCEDIKSL